MNFESMTKQRKMMLVAAAVGIISVFLPWVSIFGYSVNGMHGWGVLVFICFLVTGAVAFLGDQTTNLTSTSWMIALIASGLAAVLMVINFFVDMDKLRYLGFGFYISLAASLALVAFTYMHRSVNDSLQSGFDSLKSSFNSGANTSGTTTTTTPTTTNVSHTPTSDPTRPTV
ncbi:MAG: hypothetical protein EON98_14265 [Chitinophagaceae bacterium]|nr:MAG: hypothetical protein EON98_14265 [Chitinophagaceae bacterium]